MNIANSLDTIIHYHNLLSNNLEYYKNVEIINSTEQLNNHINIFNNIRTQLINRDYDEALNCYNVKLKPLETKIKFYIHIYNCIIFYVDNQNIDYDEYFLNSLEEKITQCNKTITTPEFNNHSLENDIKDISTNIFNEIKLLNDSVSSIHQKMYEIQNYSLGSNVINEGKNSLTSADQIELNMRKTLADLVQSEVKIIANETQKFIIQYTSMLERLEKHTTTSFDKFSKLCENTLEKKDQAVNHDLNLISKRIIIVGFVVALLTAPIVGSITGYVTAQINKNIFFNTLNNIVKTKNKQ